MRKPTPHEELYAWHANALLGVFGEELGLHGEEPECGWFKRRLVKGGVEVPARIWMYQPINEEGELVADEVLQCEVDGQYADPYEAWSWLCGNPITEAEFNYMMARKDYAVHHAPHEPAANPREKVDWLRGVPTPTFGDKRT